MSRLSNMLIVLILIFAVSNAFSQAVPQSITYQGKLTDSAGVPLSGSYTMQFKLWSTETGGTTPLWNSGPLTLQAQAGLFTVVLGTAGNPITAKDLFDGIVWIEVTVESAPPLPRVQLVSVPFAIRANDLAMPFAGGANSTGEAFTIINTGGGSAGYFENTSISSSAPSLYARTKSSGASIFGYTTGSGPASWFQIYNSGNPSPALYATTNGPGRAIHGKTTGTGYAGYFEVNRPDSTYPAIFGSTDGAGISVLGQNPGTGEAGHFEITNLSNTSTALYGKTSGSGAAVKGLANGTGKAGLFEILNVANADSTLCAYTAGIGSAGYFEASNAVNPNPTLSVRNAGTGKAGHFEITNSSNTSPALYTKGPMYGGISLLVDGLAKIGSSDTYGKLEMYSRESSLAFAELYTSGSNGELRLRDYAGNIAAVMNGLSSDTGASLSLKRDASSSGIILDGNYNHTHSSRLRLLGTNSADFNMSAPRNLSVVLPDDAICDDEIIDEPGAASSTTYFSAVPLSYYPTVTQIESCTIDAPTSGYVLVIGSCYVGAGHVYGTESYADIGVSDAPATFPRNQQLMLRIDDSVPSGSYAFPVTAHGLFEVSNGSNTFYLLGEKWSGDFAAGEIQLTCLFIPTAYGTIENTGVYSAMAATGDSVSERTVMETQTSNSESDSIRYVDAITDLQAVNENQQKQIDELKALVTSLLKK